MGATSPSEVDLDRCIDYFRVQVDSILDDVALFIAQATVSTARAQAWETRAGKTGR